MPRPILRPLSPQVLLLVLLVLSGLTVGVRAQGGFQKVLWVAREQQSSAEQLRAVRAAGFDGVNVGPGVDVAPVRAAGLGYYLDQPAGKGLLELRDSEWRPVAAEYERSRDVAALVRPGCLSVPANLAAAAAAATKAVRAVVGDGLLFVALADEASSTRHNAPLDTCRCPRCLDAFSAWMQARTPDIGELDLAWQTSFGAWAAFAPLTTDQVRRRELGGVVLPANLRPWAEWLQFQDERFAAAVRAVAAGALAGAAAADAAPPIGLTGLQPPAAFGGNDYAHLLPGLSLLEPYDIGASRELAMSLGDRGAARWTTLALPAELAGFEAAATSQLAAAAARGDRGVVVWNGAAMLGDDGRPSAAGQALQRALSVTGRALEACAGGSPEFADVWLLESQASVRAWWMLDSAADGLTWVRRLASYEAEHSTSQAARKSWVKLLMDVGVQPRFVSEQMLFDKLLALRPRCVILPAAIAMSDRACQVLQSYVHAGGTLLADHSAALYDDLLVRREHGALDALFGITERSLRWDDLQVREGRGAADGGVAELRLRGVTAERRGEQQQFLEQRPGRSGGRAVYLNLPVCDYHRIRLEPGQVARARDLRRRVLQVLRQARVEPPFDVRGEGLPTCLARSVVIAPDGRRIGCVRVDALDDMALLRQLATQGLGRVKVFFPRKVKLATLAGEPLGDVAGGSEEYDLPLDPFAGLFFVLEAR